MRVTIIPADGFVSIDGVGYKDLDLSFINTNVNAVQWYETDGDVETKNERGQIVENLPLSSLDEYEPALEKWREAHDKAMTLLAQQEAQEAQEELLEAEISQENAQ